MSRQDPEKYSLNWHRFVLFNENTTKAFEQMCRDLFTTVYLKNKCTPHSDPNNPGVEVGPETEPPREDGKPQRKISFQAKFFEDRISYSKIRESLCKAGKYYAGKLDLIYLFCNKPISVHSSAYQKIVTELSDYHIELIPVSDEDIFSMLRRFEKIAKHYFPLDPNAAIKDNSSDYVKFFKEELFLEAALNDGHAAQLKDVYIPSEYIPGNNRSNSRKVISLLLGSFFNAHERAEVKAYDPCFPLDKKVKTIMIMGKPGSGKSSFVSYMASLLPDMIKERDYFIIRLRNLKKRQINNDEPLSGLLEYMNADESHLRNAILILDGLDEICALYQDADFHKYLKKLLCNLNIIEGLQCVITSRTGYFKTDDDINKFCYIIHIENWDNDDLDKWSKLYGDIHPQLKSNIEENAAHLKKEKYSDKKAIFAVPILFYMTNARKECLVNHKSICSVYDAVLSEVADKRNYDNDPFNNMHEIISPKLARQICIEIAYSMFRSGRLNYVEEGDPYLDPTGVEEAITNATEDCETAEEKLTVSAKKRIKEIYGLTFYYNKDKTDRNAVEFAHKTIAEYYTAEKLLQLLYSCTSQIDEESFCRILAECFGYAPATIDIFHFLHEKLDMSVNSQKTAILKELLEKYFFRSVISSNLFVSPAKHSCDVYVLDKYPMMIKSTLMLFEHLNCRPPMPDEDDKKVFNNVVASLSRLTAIRSKHRSLLPFALNGFDLSDGLFSEGEFSEAHFAGANLTHADFSNANMTDAQFSGAKLKATVFSGANLAGADLTKTGLNIETDFTDAMLQGTDFSRSRFENSSFVCAEMQEANLMGCTFGKDCSFDGANLFSAMLDKAKINKADIQGAIFSDDEGEDDADPENVMVISGLTMNPEQYKYLSSLPQIILEEYKIQN